MPMNLQQKVSLAEKGTRCSICLVRNSVVLCRECVKENQLAGFCATHMFRHNERCHQSDFKKLVREATIKKSLYKNSGVRSGAP